MVKHEQYRLSKQICFKTNLFCIRFLELVTTIVDVRQYFHYHQKWQEINTPTSTSKALLLTPRCMAGAMSLPANQAILGESFSALSSTRIVEAACIVSFPFGQRRECPNIWPGRFTERSMTAFTATIKEMKIFEFQIICSGVDTGSEAFLDNLYESGCDDALVFFRDGYVCLDFSREAEDAETAIATAIQDIESARVGAIVQRIEPDDFVNLSEAASRVGLTRATMQKYARGPSKIGEDFPRPVAGVITGGKKALYSFGDVIVWLHEKGRIDASCQTIELATAIHTANRALLFRQVENDEGVKRLLKRLVTGRQSQA